MHVVQPSGRTRFIVAATIYDMPAVMDVAIRHLSGYTQSEGFPFNDFELLWSRKAGITSAGRDFLARRG